MFRFIYLIAVGLVLLGCASASVSRENRNLASQHSKDGWAAFKEKRYDSAIQSWGQAAYYAADAGRYQGGKGERYLDEAYYTSLSGHAHFGKDDVHGAAGKWREALLIKYNGAIAAADRAGTNETIGTIASVGMMLVGAAADVYSSYTAQKSGNTALASYHAQNTPFLTVARSAAAIVESASSEINRVDVAAIKAGAPAHHVLRVPVTPDAFPFSTIGRVSVRQGGYCTGSLVGAGLVLTNAHCVTTNGGSPVSLSDLTFEIEYTFGTVVAKIQEFHTHRGQDAGWGGHFGDDWAILVLDRESSIAKEGGWLGFYHRTPQAILNGEARLFQAGYSGDLNRGAFLTLHYGCKSGSYSRSEYRTNCDAWKGSSGSAIVRIDEPGMVVGLHSNRDRSSSEIAAGTTDPSRFDTSFDSGEVRVEMFAQKLKELKEKFK
jgi:V8-like Glu-specific endopeptidase